MHDNSIVKKTGQLWKAYFAFWGFLAGGFLASIALFFFDGSTVKFGGVLGIAGVFLLLGSMTLASTAIRCPVCRANWIWIPNPKADDRFGGQIAGLLTLSECPKCGATEGVKSKALHVDHHENEKAK